MELAEVALLQQNFFGRNAKKIWEKSKKHLEEIQKSEVGQRSEKDVK